MIIYMVTTSNYNFHLCGHLGGYYCYLLSFGRFRKMKAKGIIFSSAQKALDYMIDQENMRRY